MIIRQTVWRQGRHFVAVSRKHVYRPFATSIDSIEQSLENSLQETRSIETQLQSATISPIPTIDTLRSQPVSSPKTSKPPPNDPYNSRVVSETWSRYNHFLEHTAHLGSVMSPQYEPAELTKNPPRPEDITLELLMASQAHMGHSTSLWNPMNSRYIFGERQGIHIISLDVTAAHLRRACRVVQEVVERGGLVLFVGTRPGQNLSVIRAAELSGGCHLFQRWKPGSITNGNHVLRYCHIKAVDEFDREIEGYQEELEELSAIKPDLVVCLNPLENYILLRECGMHNIPTVGIIDTNADPTWVTYPIPANDDSIRCTNVIAGALGQAGKDGKDARLQNALQKKGPALPTVDLIQIREDTAAALSANKRNTDRKEEMISARDYLRP